MIETSKLAGGTYARKQIFSRSRLVAWSHGRRFALAQRLVAPFAGGRLLDYGCGDGTFAAMVHDRFTRTVGTDADAAQLADCAARFRDLRGLAFVPQAALAAEGHAGAYDVVTCMEVLEHCVAAVRRDVLVELRRLVSPSGRVVISVPIETGASLAGKQLARRVAAWRNIGDYRRAERYTWRELARMVAAGRRTVMPRLTYRGASAQGEYVYHGHKGFNWRLLEEDVRALFEVEARQYTPMPALGPLLNSQVWLVCRPR